MTNQVSFRIDDELRREIERAAAQERRPVSNLLRNVVADWAAARRRQNEQVAA